jgi:hypothetical protein
MSDPTKEDFKRYAVLVNKIRAVRGLAPITALVPIDDPRPFIRQMEQQLDEVPVGFDLMVHPEREPGPLDPPVFAKPRTHPSPQGERMTGTSRVQQK